MRRLDELGVIVAAALAGWIALCASQNPGSSYKALGTLGVAGLAYLVGRLLRRDHLLRVLTLLAVSVGVAVAVGLSPTGLSGKALAGPLGYGNADGALCVLGAGAGVIAAVSVSNVALRGLAWTLAVVDMSLTYWTRSAAAFALAVIVTVLGGIAATRRMKFALRWTAVAAPVLVLLMTVVLGEVHHNDPHARSDLERHASRALSERRIVLWSESMHLVAQHPMYGVGPGRFAVTAPEAIRDQDARWSHSLVLQQAAETGWLGAGLTVALLGWAFTTLWRSPRTRATTAIIVAGAVLCQADIDYLAQFPTLPVLLAALMALSTNQP